MTVDGSHKTVIVIDKSPAFAAPSKQRVEFDIFSKGRAGIVPLSSIVKSLWTCNVEAAVEFSRIVYDIFPGQNLIRLVISDQDADDINNWTAPQQNINHLMNTLGNVPLPSAKDSADTCDVSHGLTSAIGALLQPTEKQEAHRHKTRIENNGQIICLTSAKSESQIRLLENCVQDAIVQHNQLAAASDTDSLMPIDHCHLVLVHVHPVGDTSAIQEKPQREVSPVLSSEVLVTQSGRFTAVKLIQLAVKNFDLCLTTVTGIPMKEEQNASSSANYDVELLHAKRAHADFFKSGHAEGVLIQSKEGLLLESVSLKWCTPKTNVVELHQCTGTFRITPVDVNSRPSSCLTNFLLSGRSVMLEQPRKSGAKLISHMLTSHGGEIYIHAMATSRSILEDSPSISEGVGGRITDYRITDFGELMKDCRLAPKCVLSQEGAAQPIIRAKAQVERQTRVWPIVISDTIIFNMLSHLDPLPTLITHEQLDEDDVLECKKAIYHVVGMESRNEALPVVSSSGGTRTKGTKRESQYRQMWSELETLIRAYEDTSDNHKKVLECLLECKRPDQEKSSPSTNKDKVDKTVKEEKMDEAEMALKSLEKYQTLSEREKSDLNLTTERDSPLSPPPTKRIKAEPGTTGTPGSQSLLNIWTNRLNAVNAMRHAEFTGRLEGKNNRYDLYQHLNEEKNIKLDIKPLLPKGSMTGNASKLNTNSNQGKLNIVPGKVKPLLQTPVVKPILTRK